MSTATDTKTHDRPLMNIAELAEYLGVNVRHVRRLVQERRIPYFKWGRLLRFDVDEINQWLDRHHVMPRLR